MIIPICICVADGDCWKRKIVDIFDVQIDV